VPRQDLPEGASSQGNQLLWIVAGVYAIVLAAWTVLFTIAHRHPVAPVLLTTRRGPG